MIPDDTKIVLSPSELEKRNGFVDQVIKYLVESGVPRDQIEVAEEGERRIGLISIECDAFAMPSLDDINAMVRHIEGPKHEPFTYTHGVRILRAQRLLSRKGCKWPPRRGSMIFDRLFVSRAEAAAHYKQSNLRLGRLMLNRELASVACPDSSRFWPYC